MKHLISGSDVLRVPCGANSSAPQVRSGVLESKPPRPIPSPTSRRAARHRAVLRQRAHDGFSPVPADDSFGFLLRNEGWEASDPRLCSLQLPFAVASNVYLGVPKKSLQCFGLCSVCFGSTTDRTGAVCDRDPAFSSGLVQSRSACVQEDTGRRGPKTSSFPKTSRSSGLIVLSSTKLCSAQIKLGFLSSDSNTDLFAQNQGISGLVARDPPSRPSRNEWRKPRVEHDASTAGVEGIGPKAGSKP